MGNILDDIQPGCLYFIPPCRVYDFLLLILFRLSWQHQPEHLQLYLYWAQFMVLAIFHSDWLYGISDYHLAMRFHFGLMLAIGTLIPL